MVCSDAVERGLSFMSEVLVLLTGCTSFDISSDPLFHAFPCVVFLDPSYGFVPSRVSG